MIFQAMTGMVAGLCAGIVSAIIFLLLSVPDFVGQPIPLLALIGNLTGATDAARGWSFLLFSSAIFGLFYAVSFGRFITRVVPALLFGLASGLLWWAIGCTFMQTILTTQFPDLTSPSSYVLRTLAVSSFLTALLHGAVMGAVYIWIYRPVLLEEQISDFPPTASRSLSELYEDEAMLPRR